MIEMLALVAAILVSGSAGVASRRLRPRQADRLASRLIRFVLWFVLPPCVFVNVAHFDIASSAGVGLLIGAGCLLAGAAIAWAAARALGLAERSAGALISTALVSNTAYFGLPATILVLGSGAVTAAAAWDALVSQPLTYLVGFAIGACYGEDRAGFGARLRLFIGRNPVLWVIVPALLTPASAIPDWALEASHLTFVALAPVGFYATGVNLALPAGESDAGESFALAVGAAVAIRLLLVPALFTLVALTVGGVPKSFYIQAATPVGVNALTIAILFDLDRRLTATAIAATTLLALLGVIVATSITSL
ncbi:MAG: AEC family transporter [Actinobacteria bacterium]|nr:AEC family transporter [Actinomycetota bacterium]